MRVLVVLATAAAAAACLLSLSLPLSLTLSSVVARGREKSGECVSDDCRDA